MTRNLTYSSVLLLLIGISPNNSIYAKSEPDISLHDKPSYTQLADSVNQPGRLSVRPQEMATGIETKEAGLFDIPELAGYLVYVPPQCVGKIRVPLVVLLHGGGRSARVEAKKFRDLADKHGMIILYGNASTPGRWDLVRSILTKQLKTTRQNGVRMVDDFPRSDVPRIDSAMKHVLASYAIDPKRIALLGFSDGASYSLFLGTSNLDVFSRVAPLSAMAPMIGRGPRDLSTQFFFSAGYHERIAPHTFQIAEALQKSQPRTMVSIEFRGHEDRVDDEDLVWQWLQDSWKDPNISTELLKDQVVDPELTEESVTKISEFWSQFAKLPDSISIAARKRHTNFAPLAVESRPSIMQYVDIKKLAAAYPQVDSLLTRSKLTVEQEASIRIAVIRALVAIAAEPSETQTAQQATSDQTQNSQPSSSATTTKQVQALKNNIRFFKEKNQLKLQMLDSPMVSISQR